MKFTSGNKSDIVSSIFWVFISVSAFYCYLLLFICLNEYVLFAIATYDVTG